MLKRLTHQLFILAVIVFALTAVSFTPAPAAAASGKPPKIINNIRICWEMPLDSNICPNNLWCCDGDGCGCGD